MRRRRLVSVETFNKTGTGDDDPSLLDEVASNADQAPASAMNDDK